MNKKRLVGALIIGAVFLFTLIYVANPGDGTGGSFSLGSVPTIAVVRVEGLLVTGLGGSMAWFEAAAGSDGLVSTLGSLEGDPNVRAVVLRVNSPGGTPAAAQEIAAAIDDLQASGKVVVTSMADTAASGAYWIAATTDHVTANPGTVTGSIGVIMELANYQELYRKLGIEHETLTSGEHKDMGSTTRELTAEEREILRSMIQDLYDQFVEAVADGRGLTRDEVLALADGRVFTGNQALEAGLVDSLGGLDDAVEKAASMAGISGRYQVREVGRPSPWELFLSEARSFLRGLRGLSGLIGGGPAGPDADGVGLSKPGLLLIGPWPVGDTTSTDLGGP